MDCDVVYTNTEECRGCYKCVDRCPVNAIKIENEKSAVVSRMCIFCGNCVRVCPAKARKVRNDVENIKKLLSNNKKTFVSLAPSFSSEFFGCSHGQLIAALKKLKFYAVSETAIGADYVSAKLSSVLKDACGREDGQKLFLSSACPAVVLYIKRYAPNFIPCMNSCASPLVAHARVLRAIYGDDIQVVFIGPCIAKKIEAAQFEEVDGAVTFDELKQWMRLESVNPYEIKARETEDVFLPRRAAAGAFYPVDGGMLLSMRKYKGFSKTSNMVISGIDVIAETLNSASDGANLETPLFLELLSCQGGCVNGPCATRDDSAITRRARLLRYASEADGVLDKKNAGLNIGLICELEAQPVKRPQFSEEEIKKALEKTGKYTKKDELNCSKCGYNNCGDFARAMLEDRAEKTMCASYVRSLAQKKANALIKSTPGAVVIVQKNMRVLECNKNFARLMGEDIEELYDDISGLSGIYLNKISDFSQYFDEVFASKKSESALNYDIRFGKKILHLNVYEIEKGESAAGVFTDITEPVTRRDRTVSQAKKIIEKNVKTVQKISFLLGENAADVEAMLHSIIESHTSNINANE